MNLVAVASPTSMVSQSVARWAAFTQSDSSTLSRPGLVEISCSEPCSPGTRQGGRSLLELLQVFCRASAHTDQGSARRLGPPRIHDAFAYNVNGTAEIRQAKQLRPMAAPPDCRFDIGSGNQFQLERLPSLSHKRI